MPKATSFPHPRPAGNAHLKVLGLALSALCGISGAAAQTVAVLGTPHLSGQQPSATSPQLAHTLARLQHFAPTQVCIESLSGPRIAALMRDPGRNAEVLGQFAPLAVRLAASQQVGMGLDADRAAAAASALAAEGPVLTSEARVRLVRLQLAAYDPHSAALNWSHLSAQQRAAEGAVLDKEAAAALERLLRSPNEISALAIPLARRRGLAELCAVDVLDDEVAVGALAPALTPIVARPEVGPRLAALNDAAARQWRPDSGEKALTDLLRWYNGAAFATVDREGQWQLFRDFEDADGAGSRRLMYWHARNAEIAAGLYRRLAGGNRQRVLLIIGAAHRPFIEAQLRSQPWLDVVPAERLLGGRL